MRYFLTSLVVGFALLSQPAAHAQASNGFSEVFENFFGTDANQAASAACTPNQGDSSLVGVINGIFCGLELRLGITGVGSVTKSNGSGSSMVTIHCDVSANTSGTYANTAYCWTCVGASCSSTSSFSRFLEINWTMVADRTVNKGTFVLDDGAFAGTTAGDSAISITYDLGTSTTTKTLTVDMASQINSAVSAAAISAQKVGTIRKAAMVMATGTQKQVFSVAEDLATNLALLNFQYASGPGSCTSGMEQTGTSDDAASATPACSVCVSLSDGTTAGSTSSLCSAESSLTLAASPDSSSNVAGYTPSSVASWGSMSATPSAL